MDLQSAIKDYIKEVIEKKVADGETTVSELARKYHYKVPTFHKLLKGGKVTIGVDVLPIFADIAGFDSVEQFLTAAQSKKNCPV